MEEVTGLGQKDCMCCLPTVMGTLLYTVEEDKEARSGISYGFKQKHNVGMMFIVSF